MTPRLTSRMVSTEADRASASSSSRTATPAEPWRSKKADCGLIAATCPATASRPTRENSASPAGVSGRPQASRSEEHTSELQSRGHLVCRLLLEKKKPDQAHAIC